MSFLVASTRTLPQTEMIVSDTLNSVKAMAVNIPQLRVVSKEDSVLHELLPQRVRLSSCQHDNIKDEDVQFIAPFGNASIQTDSICQDCGFVLCSTRRDS
eukprot:scaffold3044_cov176-Ochromonas_danica.AAC.14